jgi:hypothetical protein
MFGELTSVFGDERAQKCLDRRKSTGELRVEAELRENAAELIVARRQCLIEL